jgi:plastocyanin
MENIPFLLAIGLVMPTIVYTVWSITELSRLPHFDQVGVTAVAHGHAATDAPGTATAAGVVAGTAVAPDAVHVSMRSMSYQPREIEILVGTTVTWTNDDPFDHAVAHGTPDLSASEKLFASGDFPGGSSFSYTFEGAGTYDVYCSTVGHYAAGMTMTVVVKE